MAGDVTEQVKQEEEQDEESVVEEVARLFEEGVSPEALEQLDALHPADQADVISLLDEEVRNGLLPRLSTEALAQILSHLRDDRRLEVIEEVPTEELAPALDLADVDVAVDILHDLPPERARTALALMTTAPDVRPLLPYSDESAGGRMTSAYISLQLDWTVDQTLAYLRRTGPTAEQVFYLYVVDDQNRLEGVVSLRELVVSSPETRIRDLMTPEVFSVQATEDQEDVARHIQRYNFIALPVVDSEDRLMGVVSVDDIMDVVEEEATEDIYRMAGLGTQETVFSPVPAAVRRRVPWLLVNLAMGFVAALAVSLFEDTISEVAILAVFMPVIAGHGGNTGTQAITLVVRGLALGEVRPADALRIAWKEVRFGMIHGFLAGSAVAGLAFALSGNMWLALVVFCAMQGNVITAAVVGSLLPLAMRRLGIDPALASAIWLTTFTDLTGFLLLLGLGALLVNRLA